MLFISLRKITLVLGLVRVFNQWILIFVRWLFFPIDVIMCLFILNSANVMNCMDQSPHVEPTLHIWNKIITCYGILFSLHIAGFDFYLLRIFASPFIGNIGLSVYFLLMSLVSR